MAAEPANYAARLDVDYSEQLDRVSTFFRLIWVIPIGIILALLTDSGGAHTVGTGRTAGGAGGIMGGLAVATALMIVMPET